jgi:nucleotidyltransferase AbiEii toxin of type IV toxin-antitoxin system
MIHPQSFTKPWLDSHRAKPGYERINPPLVEKMIHALALVEQLSFHGLVFIFKGGTSLVLLLEDAGRFSIDIDIITTASREDIEKVLAIVCSGTPFYRHELNEKRSYKEGVPKAHYMLYYKSSWTYKEDHILLDILFETHSYPALVQLPVKAEWIHTHQGDVMVSVPTAAAIAGDKLTAFAPNTTGILYGQGKEVEIVKQLHDVGRLYHHIDDMEVFIAAFSGTVAKEITYRGGACTPDQVLEDIVAAAALVARRERNKEEPHKAHFAEMKRGLLQFINYQTRGAFRIDEAITAGAKAALLAARIKTRDTSPLPVFEAGMKKNDYLVIQSAYIDLNKLQVEPLFYWHHALRLLYPQPAAAAVPATVVPAAAKISTGEDAVREA